jgi:prevent-host-death family protein
MVMKNVRIGELKAKLSELLRAVRAGESITVLDRNIAVAQIVPVQHRSALRIRKPALGTPAPNMIPLPKLSKRTIDVLELLLEDRQRQR